MGADNLKALLKGPPLVRIAAAESVTCGRVQARIGLISGASEFFLGGITAYHPDIKVRQLGVDRGAANAGGGVSSAVAEQMALGARALFGADAAVATTGFAEPDPAHAVAEPFAWWAVAVGSGGDAMLRSGRVDCPGCARGAAQERIAEEAIAQLSAAIAEFRRSRQSG